jgi:hypothetical protein
MQLLHPVFDQTYKGFKINDPIKTIFVKTDKTLIQDSNYYISVHIDTVLLSFTNKFKKVTIDGIELYELDLFAEKLTLLMNLVKYGGRLSLLGWEYLEIPEGNLSAVITDNFTDIYYEKDENITSSESLDQLIVYNDSQLTEKIRIAYRCCNTKMVKKYGENVDNVVRYCGGLCGIVYKLVNQPIKCYPLEF